MPLRLRIHPIRLIALVLAAAFMPLGSTQRPDQPAATAAAYEAPVLDVAELRARELRGEPLLIVDVRSPAAYEASHIAGARSVPWSRLPEGHRPLPKDRLMALYCT